MADLPSLMKAAALDAFGGPQNFSLQSLPVPSVDPDEILVKVHTAGVGVWDPAEREGEMARWMQGEPRFPYIVGSDGSGIVVAIGSEVQGFGVGDRVYAASFLNPKGGFYAEYAAVKAGGVASIPNGLSMEEAGALASDGVTALRGLIELAPKEGETVLVFGASGGVGHLAAQLANRMGARVLAVASGSDGVSMVEKMDVSGVVDGHGNGLAEALRRLAPNGLDAVLATAGGEVLDTALAGLHPGGRLAWPNGVSPAPNAPEGIEATSYDGQAGPDLLRELNRLIEAGPFTVHVDRTFSLDEVADAHHHLQEHFLGKLAIRVSD